MYRPVEVFGISAGLGFRLQGDYYRHTNYTVTGAKYVDFRSSSHTGYFQVPIEIHLFKQMPKSTFEFSTGPIFSLPVLQNVQSTSFNSNGDKLLTTKDNEKFTTTFMKDNARLGWNLLLGAELNLADHVDLFVGPQINFLNIASFKASKNEDRLNGGDDYNCSLGLKLGFRFHCEQ